MDATRSGQNFLETSTGRVAPPTPPGPRLAPAQLGPFAPGDQSLSQTRPLVQVRGNPPAGRSGPNQPALKAQGAAAQENRGTLISNPNEIIKHELSRDPELKKHYDRLNPQQQQSFQGLVLSQVADGTKVDTKTSPGIGMGLMMGGGSFGGGNANAANLSAKEQAALKEQGAANMARQSLYGLLRNDKLSATDSKGKTLLNNLDTLRTQPLAPGIDRNQLLRGAVNDLAMAGFPSTQGGSIVAEELKSKLATEKPADYVSLVGSLASPGGKARLGNLELNRNDKALTANGADFQTTSGKLFTNSMSEGAARGELFRQEVTGNPQSQKRFAALSADDKKSFQNLYNASLPGGNSAQPPGMPKDLNKPPTPEEVKAQQAFFESSQKIFEARQDRTNLTTLLGDGKLGMEDSKGKSLLSNLQSLRSQSFAREGEHKLDGSQIYSEVLGQTARPGSISQGSRGTCTVTTMEHLQATREPSEYVRIMTGLTGASGNVRLRSGDILTRDSGLVAPDNSGRTAASRVYQASMMEYANGPDQDYRNDQDGHFNAKDGTPLLNDRGKLRGGLPMQSLEKVSDDVMMGDFRYREGSVRGADSKTIATEMTQALSDKKAIQVGMRWGRDPDDRDAYHALSVYKMDDKYVYLRNPWGAGEQGHTDPSTGVVRQALRPDPKLAGPSPFGFPGRPAPNDPTLPTGEAGTLRMKREDFFDNLDSYLVQREEPKTPIMIPVPFVPGGFLPFFNPFN